MPPLPVGTIVKVIMPAALDGECPEGADASLYETSESDPTSIVAIQFINEDGEIVDEEQPEYQYLLDQEEPFPDLAMRPEYVVPV